MDKQTKKSQVDVYIREEGSGYVVSYSTPGSKSLRRYGTYKSFEAALAASVEVEKGARA